MEFHGKDDVKQEQFLLPFPAFCTQGGDNGTC